MTFSHFCEFFRVLPLAFRSRAAKPAEYKTCLLYTSRSDIPEEDWDKYLEQTPASPEDRLVLEQCLKALDDSERQVVILHALSLIHISYTAGRYSSIITSASCSIAPDSRRSAITGR